MLAGAVRRGDGETSELYDLVAGDIAGLE